MKKEIERPEDLDRSQLANLLLQMFHRIIVHYALWFTEVERRKGLPQALEILDTAFKRSYEIQANRLAKRFGFELSGGIPKLLLDMPEEDLWALINDTAVNWLANDGVWFQAVEFTDGMLEARSCNDACWAKFSPFEAWSIKRFLNLPEQPGLEGLKKALQFRMYARINVQSIVDEGPDSFVFQMNECRVQRARKRKGLEDHQCKSAGLIEYPTFATMIDSRIVTECIGCPPDDHPQEWWCAWRFRINETIQ